MGKVSRVTPASVWKKLNTVLPLGLPVLFTVIGDAVNLASRLESMNKTLHARILVGDSVKELASSHFVFKGLGSVGVEGKARPIGGSELTEEKRV